MGTGAGVTVAVGVTVEAATAAAPLVITTALRDPTSGISWVQACWKF